MTVAAQCATLLSFSLLSAQPRPSDDPLLHWMDRIAQQALQRRENAIAEVRTVAGAERRKQAVREKILSMMGGLPDYKGPLNPRVTGAHSDEADQSVRSDADQCGAKRRRALLV